MVGIWYLTSIGAGNRAYSGRIVEKRVGVAKKPAPGVEVVNGAGGGDRVLEAEDVLVFAAGKEIFGIAGLAAIFERRCYRAAAAAIDPDGALLGICGEVFRGDVEDGGVMKPVLGRKRACNERHASDEARFEILGEPGDAIGKNNAVDAELHIGMLVAHVIIAARCRILGNARELGDQNVADILVAPLRRVVDVLAGDLS